MNCVCVLRRDVDIDPLNLINKYEHELAVINNRQKRDKLVCKQDDSLGFRAFATLRSLSGFCLEIIIFGGRSYYLPFTLFQPLSFFPFFLLTPNSTQLSSTLYPVRRKCIYFISNQIQWRAVQRDVTATARTRSVDFTSFCGNQRQNSRLCGGFGEPTTTTATTATMNEQTSTRVPK